MLKTDAPRGMIRGIVPVLPRFLAALSLLTIMCVVAPSAQALDVHNDMGGSVEERFAEIERLRAKGTQVRILGTCVSACTLYLGLPNTCVSPSARLGFHGPGTRSALPLPRRAFERISLRMASYYPGQIRAWFLQEARMRTGSYYTISGAQAISMDARACT